MQTPTGAHPPAPSRTGPSPLLNCGWRRDRRRRRRRGVPTEPRPPPVGATDSQQPSRPTCRRDQARAGRAAGRAPRPTGRAPGRLPRRGGRDPSRAAGGRRHPLTRRLGPDPAASRLPGRRADRPGHPGRRAGLVHRPEPGAGGHRSPARLLRGHNLDNAGAQVLAAARQSAAPWWTPRLQRARPDRRRPAGVRRRRRQDRLAGRPSPDPWAWTPWQYAHAGRFGGRWDDPVGRWRTPYAGRSTLA